MTINRIKLGSTADFTPELGSCVKVGNKQIAVFYLPNTEQQWFAVDNYNPQNDRVVLSRGIVGDEDNIPYVACPLHKHRFSLLDGTCLTDDQYKINHYKVEVEEDIVFLCAE